MLFGCTDLVDPRADDENPWLVDPSAPALAISGGEQCEDHCEAVEHEGEDHCVCCLQSCEIRMDGSPSCVCTLEGITGEVAGGDGTPEPWPPEPPLYPHPVWEMWPAPPGTTSPDQPGCDVQAGEGDMVAELECSTGIARGEEATCQLSLTDAQLEWIYGWWFTGDDGLTAERSGTPISLQWQGKVVQSGMVHVMLKASGRDSITVMSRIEVLPRTGTDWEWTLGSGIHYSQGGLSTEPSDWNETTRARLCHPLEGCSPLGQAAPQDKWFVQPQNPADGNGFILWHIQDGGPNQGAWYVESVDVDVRMASAINPDFLSGGTVRPDGCAPIDSMNIWEYNHSSCGTGDQNWGSTFISYLWAHEQLHVDKGVTYLGDRPEFVVPVRVEGLIAENDSEFQGEISQATKDSGLCFGWAAALHGTALSEPEHSPPAFDIWWWSSASLAFVMTPANSPFPSQDAPPNECLEGL